jgi:hypothetical protein
MSKEISYGNYTFPHPYPFLGISHEPVIVSGVLDHSILTASLVGELTGCNLTSLKRQKDNLILALSTGFQTLIVGEKTYSYAQPVSVSFSSSNIRNTLPYSIDFTIQNETDFSQFYGIRDPIDTWSFNEAEDRTVSAVHTVSAYGNKITGDSFTNASNFVNSRTTGFDINLASFFSGKSPILISKNEEINRFENFYSVVENWKCSISPNDFDKQDSIVRANCSINYDQDGVLNISVNGTIEGGISGSASTGYFTDSDAKLFAQNALANCKSEIENDLYGLLFTSATSNSYDIDTGNNSISFSYEFSNAHDIRPTGVLHDYSSSVSANKDSSEITVSTQGRVYYKGLNNQVTGSSPELETKFQMVNAYFSGVNPFIQSFYTHDLFITNITDYSLLPLNASVRSLNVTKDPFSPSIDYDYTYSNFIDFFSGNLLNPSISINTEQEYSKHAIQQTVDNSFAVQRIYTSNKKVSVSVNGQIPSGKNVNTVVNIVSGYIKNYSVPNGFLTENSIETGNGQLAMSQSFFFK